MRRTKGMGVASTTKAGFIKTHHYGTGTAGADNDYCILNNAANFYTMLDQAFLNIFDDQVEGGQTKVMFCSQKWLGAFTARSGDNSVGLPPVEFPVTTGDPNVTYGLRVGKYQSAYGLVNLISAPVLRGIYEDFAVVLDFKNLAMKVLPGRDTHIVTNAQLNDEDGLKEYLITELGLMLKHEQTCGVLRLCSS